jgi:hypothetical protein
LLEGEKLCFVTKGVIRSCNVKKWTKVNGQKDKQSTKNTKKKTKD